MTDQSTSPNPHSAPTPGDAELADLRLARFSLDRSGDAVIWIAPDARILYVNEATCTLLGYTRAELLHLRITDINAEIPHSAWPERWRRVQAEGTVRTETRHRRKDGSEVPIEVTTRYLEYAGRAYLCSFVRDISERKQAEARLRRWAEIFERTTTGVVISDAGSTTIDLVNPAFARMYGVEVADLLGTPIADLYAPEAHGDYLRARAQLSDHDHVVFESRHRRRDGTTFPVLVDVAAVRAGPVNAPFRIANVRDLSALKAAEARLLEQERALSTLRERERLARELHDNAGQSLAFLQLQGRTARDQLIRGETTVAEATLTRMLDAAQASLTDIREFILGVNLQPTPEQSLFDGLEHYLERYQRLYELNVGLDVPPELRSLEVSPMVTSQVLRIVQEALANVRKHAQATVVQVYVEAAADGFTLVVADNGCGFDLRTVDSAAEAHYGLRGMRERADEIGATLRIDSRPGLGTRVILQTPLTARPTERLDQVRVLLVDDHPLFLQGMQTLLSDRGVPVVGVATSGEEALTLARTLRPSLVLMDVEMPGMGGIAATRALTAELPETIVVMLTMAEDEAYLFEALRSGAAGYLLKGLDADAFFDLIAGAVRGETPLAPGVATRVLAAFAERSDLLPSAAVANDDRMPANPTPHPEAPVEVGASLVPVTLSERQIEILQLVAEGYTYPEIGAQLHLSRHTVRYHMREIITQLHLKSRAEVIALARRYSRDTS
ncbi:MAG: PAS domain S-box protein [Blastochloris sp.]|nr:PAS domain S-box protein [Blastochloris sp.]